MKPVSSPFLSREYLVDRLCFAGNNQLGFCMIGNKSSSQLQLRLVYLDGNERVWQSRGERFATWNISARISFSDGCYMFWERADARIELVPIRTKSMYGNLRILSKSWEYYSRKWYAFLPLNGIKFLIYGIQRWGVSGYGALCSEVGILIMAIKVAGSELENSEAWAPRKLR